MCVATKRAAGSTPNALRFHLGAMTATGHIYEDDMHRPELLRYHPNRFSASRDYFPALYDRYQNSVSSDGVWSIDQFKEILGVFASTYWNLHLAAVPLAVRPRNTKRAHEEFDMFWHVARFLRCGKNIFHFPHRLTDLLKLTDVDDVQWGSIRLPYSCFYLWFGPQQAWWFSDTNYAAEGAYVTEIASGDFRAFDLLVTTTSPGAPCAEHWNYVVKDDPYYYFSFEVEGPERTVGDTFRQTVATSDDFNKKWPRAEIPPEAKEWAARHGKKLRSLPRKDSAQGQKVLERLQGLPVFREVLKLVVNCLCYLSSPSREITTRYPDAESTRVITPGGTPLERARARNRAAREGYTLIHFCGDSLEHEAGTFPTGRELSAHWRRGHWRNQAIGVGRSEHKLMWIRPTLVRKDKADAGVPGHLSERRSISPIATLGRPAHTADLKP